MFKKSYNSNKALSTLASPGGLTLVVEDLAACEMADNTPLQPPAAGDDHDLQPGALAVYWVNCVVCSQLLGPLAV